MSDKKIEFITVEHPTLGTCHLAKFPNFKEFKLEKAIPPSDKDKQEWKDKHGTILKYKNGRNPERYVPNN